MPEPLIYTLLGIALTLAAIWVRHRVWSFHAQKTTSYSDQTPAFDIREVLNGPLDSEGLIYDFTGRVAARFTARMTGTWQGGEGTLTESFRYSTGRTQNRAWSLHLKPDGRITAHAPDLIGQGSGQQSGPAVRMTYRIKLDEQAGGHVLDVTDWMYLAGNGVVLNRSEFRKFGIKVGELFATMRPAE